MEDNKLNPTGVPEEVNNVAQEGADTLADKVADKVEAIGDAAGDIGGKVVDTVTGVVGAAGESADELGDKVVEAVKGTGEAADSFGEKVADTVSETFGAANSGAAEAEKPIQPNAIYTNTGAPVGEQGGQQGARYRIACLRYPFCSDLLLLGRKYRSRYRCYRYRYHLQEEEPARRRYGSCRHNHGRGSCRARSYLCRFLDIRYIR